jgi:hypothetical protein
MSEKLESRLLQNIFVQKEKLATIHLLKNLRHKLLKLESKQRMPKEKDCRLLP